VVELWWAQRVPDYIRGFSSILLTLLFHLRCLSLCALERECNREHDIAARGCHSGRPCHHRAPEIRFLDNEPVCRGAERPDAISEIATTLIALVYEG
jgi:hypothetical protein